MKIQVEQIGNLSAEAIINIILPIQQKEFNVPITLEDQPDLLDIESAYYMTGGGFWGAKIDGELVGTIAMIKFDSHSAAIRKMFVKKEFRGKNFGAAQLLLETLINYCRLNGIKNLYLGTIDLLKAAIRFYEKNGFDLITKDCLPELFPRMAADNTYFQLKLV